MSTEGFTDRGSPEQQASPLDLLLSEPPTFDQGEDWATLLNWLRPLMRELDRTLPDGFLAPRASASPDPEEDWPAIASMIATTARLAALREATPDLDAALPWLAALRSIILDGERPPGRFGEALGFLHSRSRTGRVRFDPPPPALVLTDSHGALSLRLDWIAQTTRRCARVVLLEAPQYLPAKVYCREYEIEPDRLRKAAHRGKISAIRTPGAQCNYYRFADVRRRWPDDVPHDPPELRSPA